MKAKRKLAVVLANMDVEYASETLFGIQEEAQKRQCDIFIFNAFGGTDETLKHNLGEYNIYFLPDFSKFDGIILLAGLIQGHSTFKKVIEEIRKSGVPTVSIDAPLKGFCYVGVGNYRSMKEMVSHFIEHHGFTKINFIAGQDFNTDSQERLAAYCDALKEHNIPIEEKRIYRGIFTVEHGKESAYAMLQDPDGLPQAVVCASDSIALGVRSVFEEAGIEIPNKVALSGFDNIFEARNCVPRLTTVDRDLKAVGCKVVSKLSDFLDGKAALTEEVFPTTPIFSESCGCVRKEQEDIKSIRRKYLDLNARYQKYLNNSNLMMEDLNDSKSFDDFLERLKPYMEELKCGSFYLCLDKELVEDLKFVGQDEVRGKFHNHYLAEGYPDRMAVPLAWEDRHYIKCEDFSTVQMWPRLHTDEACHTYIFSPLHFRDRCQGYVMVADCEFAITSPLYCNWMVNLSNILENMRKQAEMRFLLEELDKMHVIDALTGLYNRVGFARYTKESFHSCIQANRGFMVLFADMDGLKTINDQFGHDKGDVAIKAVADALKNACNGSEVCARFGGDEFVVYADGCSTEDAELFCMRFEKEMQQWNEKCRQPFKIGASYGYEMIVPQKGESIDKFIEMADKRMYQQKKEKHRF